MPYIINKETLALVPKGSKTEIIESNNLITSKETTLDLIENNCIYNGSSLEGRQKGSIYLIGTPYKPPIIVDDINEIIMIPTHSARNKNCIWINLKNLLSYTQKDEKSITIIFRNHQQISINISYQIFDRQVLRATRLESTLRGRNNQKTTLKS